MRSDSGSGSSISPDKQQGSLLSEPDISGDDAQIESILQDNALSDPLILGSVSSNVRRPATSPVHSPQSKSSIKFCTARLNQIGSYKRARTVSPIIDENSSDVEADQASAYSCSDSELGDTDSFEHPALAATQLLPTPLRESISSADIAAAFPPMSTQDKNIEVLMTEQSLRLDDRTLKSDMGSTNSDINAAARYLPSYQEAIESPNDVLHSTLLPPSGKEQLDLIRPMKNWPLHVGDTWYLISRVWYLRWSTACSGQLEPKAENSDDPVGPIDNSPLLDPDSTPMQAHLKANITEHLDYEMVPQEGWNLLVQWYGVAGPVFDRKVIEGLSPGQESVEFHPPVIRLWKIIKDDIAQGTGVPCFSMSVSLPLSELKAKVKEILNFGTVPDTDIRFWHLPEPTDDEYRSGLVAIHRMDTEGVECIDAGEDKAESYKADVTLRSLGIEQIEVLLAVEVRIAGHWITESAPMESAPGSKAIFAQQSDFFSNLQQGATSSSSTPSHSLDNSQTRVTRSQTAMDRTMGRSRGLRGLNNLGNTCFMNSALQCMSNTYELQQYFFSGAYRDELNIDNPLGMGGAIANAFGNLINNIWNGQGGSFWPREFKYALSRFAPQFSGYAQHDSQELLAFLLDGLHEDLNRIIKKPYVEAPDWDGGNERDLVAFAKHQWDLYKARNDSVIVDLFQGQYRSTLVCPECSKVSIKFDPFMYLTLPIPNKKMWRGEVYFVPLGTQQPMQKLDVQVPGGSTVGKLRQKVAAHFGVDARRLICGEIWHHKIYKWYDDYEPVVDIKDSDLIYFWEAAAAPRPSKQRSYRYHRSVEEAEESLEIPDDEYAIIPVFTYFSPDSSSSTSSHAFVNRRTRSDAAGVPFLISIPKKQVNDVKAIRDAVIKGYSRFASDVQSLYADSAPTFVHEAIPNGGSGKLSDWEMVDNVSRDEGGVELVVSQQVRPDDDAVTEIRENGEAVVIHDTAVATNELDSDTAIIIRNSDVQNAAGRYPGLIIRFSLTEAGQGLPKGSESSAEHLSETLEERQARLQKSIAAISDMNTDEMVDDTSITSREKETSSSSVIPLVFTGGALICTWPSKAQNHFTAGGSSDDEAWGVYQAAVDEDIRIFEKTESSKSKLLTIEDCMDEFTREEQLGEDDPWYCPFCKEFRQATKKFDLWKVPDILVVHLKRFSAGRHTRDKLDTFVDFPLEGLDLTDRVEGTKAVRRVQEEAQATGEELSESMLGSGILRPLEDNDDAVATDRPIYDLYAVDNHFGGLGGGHYTAFAKSPADGKWYEFDDSNVRPVVKTENVKSSSAYLLFYRRRTARPIGGKSRQKFQEAAKTKPTHMTEELAADAVTPPSASLEGANDDSGNISSNDAPDWSLNLRDDLASERNGEGWSSTGMSPASSSRAPSPTSDIANGDDGLESV